MADVKHTPGPWRWDVRTDHKLVRLQGDRPPGWFVMGFDRWGFNSAAPSFRDPEHDIMRRVEHYAVQRKPHHVGWDQWINHPDALLIAAAPDLLAELEAMRAVFYDDRCPRCGIGWLYAQSCVMSQALEASCVCGYRQKFDGAAISKAKGEG